MKTSSVPLYWWSEHTVAEPVIRHTPGELLPLKSCATCAINRRCNQPRIHFKAAYQAIPLNWVRNNQDDMILGTEHLQPELVTLSAYYKQNKTQSDCLNNRLKVWKVGTLTTSRGLTMTADIKAAPPADKALSPNLKFSFTIGFDFDSNFASSSTTIRNQFNFTTALIRFAYWLVLSRGFQFCMGNLKKKERKWFVATLLPLMIKIKQTRRDADVFKPFDRTACRFWLIFVHTMGLFRQMN